MESTNSTNKPSLTALTPEQLLDERERAITLLSFLPETKSMTLYCARTGVAIADMNLLQQAGKLPYLSTWKDSQAFHPLFSLSQVHLLSWTRKNWNSLFKHSASDSITDLQKQQFSIAFMAILHTMNCLDQQTPALPSFHVVSANMQRLLELAYWYNYLDSKRFRFPTLRINKMNSNGALADIGTYFDICDSVRHDWETSKDAKLEDSKLEAARRAEKAVRAGHYKSVSKKALWNWFLSSLAAGNSKKYSLPEWKEWKEESAKLWFASENQQLQYTVDDVDSIEEVYIAECTLGTTVSHTFNAELNKIRAHIDSHSKIFSIDWNETLTPKVRLVDGAGNSRTTGASTDGTVEAPPAPGLEPQLNEFFSRADYLRAKAKWDISCFRYNAWLEKQPREIPNESTNTGEDDANHPSE